MRRERDTGKIKFHSFLLLSLKLEQLLQLILLKLMMELVLSVYFSLFSFGF